MLYKSHYCSKIYFKYSVISVFGDLIVNLVSRGYRVRGAWWSLPRPMQRSRSYDRQQNSAAS
jgi:hypothetical protein